MEELKMAMDEFGRRGLSPREREVFSLLAQGFTCRSIARRLVLSHETVRSHARNGMRRLGARTRAHAIALALSRGEIVFEPAPRPRAEADVVSAPRVTGDELKELAA